MGRLTFNLPEPTPRPSKYILINKYPLYRLNFSPPLHEGNAGGWRLADAASCRNRLYRRHEVSMQMAVFIPQERIL